MDVEYKTLFVPPLDELSDVINEGLEANYKSCSCKVVKCPNLSCEPFFLASPGICGNTRLADVGGVPYLIPKSQYQTKVYDLQQVSEQVNLPGCLILGAGAGSKHVVGCNCEMIPNIRTSGGQNDRNNLTHISKVDESDVSKHILESYEEKHNSSSQFCLLANLYCSDGKTGNVLEVKARSRKGLKDFVGCIRNAIKSHYGDDQPVGMGGTFIVKKGKLKIHVMPDFSAKPLETEEDVSNWLKFYEADSPFVCMATFITSDCGLDLRVEHTHGYSKVNAQGGHYHIDTTPEEVEYLGYFCPAEYIYRIDRPKITHQIGRD